MNTDKNVENNNMSRCQMADHKIQRNLSSGILYYLHYISFLTIGTFPSWLTAQGRESKVNQRRNVNTNCRKRKGDNNGFHLASSGFPQGIHGFSQETARSQDH
tara:strand:+ start:342 stop:650 length:309 start_codon:yes stop_codon:yes gene_type:complete